MSIYNMNNYVPTVLLSLTNNCANITDQGISNCIRNIFNANRLELMKILDFTGTIRKSYQLRCVSGVPEYECVNKGLVLCGNDFIFIQNGIENTSGAFYLSMDCANYYFNYINTLGNDAQYYKCNTCVFYYPRALELYNALLTVPRS